MKNLNEMLDETAKEFPADPALVFPVSDPGRRGRGPAADAALGRPYGRKGEERCLDFRGLREAVLRTAAAFHDDGIRHGDCVAIVLRNSPAFVIAYLGLTRLGAVAVPINFMVQKASELAFMLEHCGAKGVVTQREFLSGLLEARKGLPGLTRLWVTDERRGKPKKGEVPGPGKTEDFWAFSAGGPAERSFPEVAPDDTASILYTSGTTGKPKGVMLTHWNLVSNAEGAIEALRATHKDVVLTLLPMFHTFAWTGCVMVPLRLGVKNVISPSITPPAAWLKQMGRHKVTVFVAVPQLYAVLAKQASGLKGLFLRYWCFRKARLCVSGAAPLNPRTLKNFQAAFGRVVIEGYGLTETSPVATVNPIAEPLPGTVGVPIRDVRVRIAGEDGKELPVGQEGEVQIQGPNVMKGYYRDLEATRQAVDPDGWFRTGDVGVLDESGRLSIRDRLKDMIIIKGLKVFSAQVESVLQSHPAVKEAAVIGVPDAAGDERIKAFIVPEDGMEADSKTLRDFCRKSFDPYKRPREIEIVEELPKNALQKVLKRELRKREIEKAGKAGR